MLDFMMKRLRGNKKKGFTLVELIVVLVILAILLAILVPALLGYIDKSRDKQVLVDARTAYLAAETTVSEDYAKAATAITASTVTFGTGTTANVGTLDAPGQAAYDLAGIKDTTDWKATATIGSDHTISQFVYVDYQRNKSVKLGTNGTWNDVTEGTTPA